MDIDLRPPMNGCLLALVTVMTLGLYPLLRKMGEGHFIRRMDEAGFETRGGKRFAWSEVPESSAWSARSRASPFPTS